eukprot:TRINITY_DN8073_c0_g1_i1.p1 TRINITY_DN8073_c0_g1~~TRINITY_DN8073_c0_g1_i1.p1  ORF type:complete len:399 (-),score=106.92 TRINITY_DN8073_c0_g1_i1:98-1228(-)
MEATGMLPPLLVATPTPVRPAAAALPFVVTGPVAVTDPNDEEALWSLYGEQWTRAANTWYVHHRRKCTAAERAAPAATLLAWVRRGSYRPRAQAHQAQAQLLAQKISESLAQRALDETMRQKNERNREYMERIRREQGARRKSRAAAAAATIAAIPAPEAAPATCAAPARAVAYTNSDLTESKRLRAMRPRKMQFGAAVADSDTESDTPECPCPPVVEDDEEGEAEVDEESLWTRYSAQWVHASCAWREEGHPAAVAPFLAWAQHDYALRDPAQTRLLTPALAQRALDDLAAKTSEVPTAEEVEEENANSSPPPNKRHKCATPYVAQAKEPAGAYQLEDTRTGRVFRMTPAEAVLNDDHCELAHAMFVFETSQAKK